MVETTTLRLTLWYALASVFRVNTYWQIHSFPILRSEAKANSFLCRNATLRLSCICNPFLHLFSQRFRLVQHIYLERMITTLALVQHNILMLCLIRIPEDDDDRPACRRRRQNPPIRASGCFLKIFFIAASADASLCSCWGWHCTCTPLLRSWSWHAAA